MVVPNVHYPKRIYVFKLEGTFEYISLTETNWDGF